jgi:RNA polymerase-binding transcription factor DksA
MNRATMTTKIPRSEHPDFERKLRDRSRALRTEIRDTLLRTDAEQYARLAGEVHDTQEEALADLFVDVNLAEITRDVEELRDIEAALGRMHAGAYGICVDCREPIDRERLQAYPTARRCLLCQRRHDRARAVGAPPSL